jgi:hypothetical protein
MPIEIDSHRRRFLGNAAATVEVAGAFSLLPARLRAAVRRDQPGRVGLNTGWSCP